MILVDTSAWAQVLRDSQGKVVRAFREMTCAKICVLSRRIPKCIGLSESVFRAIVNRSRTGLLTISWPYHSQEGELKV